MQQEIIAEVSAITGEDYVATRSEHVESYLKDETVPSLVPERAEDSIVVRPGDAEEVAAIVQLAAAEKVPVVPRGSGTGLVAGAVPTRSSIIISTERLNKIKEVDEDNFTVTCGAGVTLEQLLERLKEEDDLFFPIHPGDEGATIGGMVINNAGGARAVKHGVMRNHVRGLEFVTPSGQIIKCGGKTLKNVAGYDLMHLLVGSEGTLGIVTEATISVEPEPEHEATLLISFAERKQAIEAVPEIMKAGSKPLALEYIERDMAEMAAEHLGESWPPAEGSVDLMIVLAENNQDILYESALEIENICKDLGAVETLIAERREEQERLLTVRSNIDTATDKEDLADDVDAAVPPACIDDFLSDLLEIYEDYGAKLSAYGHAADGNLHIYIYKEKGEVPNYYQELKQRFYRKTQEYGGTIAAEHGIGKTKKYDLPMQSSKDELELMKGIKQVFDPAGIMNPDTIFNADDSSS